MVEELWMIYGATGYTGRLIAEEAVKRGHRPILAGRSRDKLKSLAERLDLDCITFSVADVSNVASALQEANVDLVLHAAGPFINTAGPMLDACLQSSIHYLDIAGEIPVLERVFNRGEEARGKGIVLVPGVGFDVVPSDCLARYVAEKVPTATDLEIVIDALGLPDGGRAGPSAGTLKTTLETLSGGNVVRRGGKLIPWTFGTGRRAFQLLDGEREALVIPWGDLSTAYRSTGIPNITTYMTFPPYQLQLARYTGHLAHLLLKAKPLRGALATVIERTTTGPDKRARETGRSRIYARAFDRDQNAAEAWLETVEAYQFTALSAVRAVERVLDGDYRGALTPAQAFGMNFALEIDGTKRWDTLN